MPLCRIIGCKIHCSNRNTMPVAQLGIFEGNGPIHKKGTLLLSKEDTARVFPTIPFTVVVYEVLHSRSGLCPVKNSSII